MYNHLIIEIIKTKLLFIIRYLIRTKDQPKLSCVNKLQIFCFFFLKKKKVEDLFIQLYSWCYTWYHFFFVTNTFIIFFWQDKYFHYSLGCYIISYHFLTQSVQKNAARLRQFALSWRVVFITFRSSRGLLQPFPL